jgi:hypothetical protein
MQKYIADIKSGFRQENHILLPSIEEKLGFENEPSDGVCEDDFAAIEKHISERIKLEGTGS